MKNKRSRLSPARSSDLSYPTYPSYDPCTSLNRNSRRNPPSRHHHSRDLLIVLVKQVRPVHEGLDLAPGVAQPCAHELVRLAVDAVSVVHVQREPVLVAERHRDRSAALMSCVFEDVLRHDVELWSVHVEQAVVDTEN